MHSSARWIALYALVAVLAIIAALTIIILNGHDVNLLVAALVAIVPLFAGIGVLLKQGQDVVNNTADAAANSVNNEVKP